MSKTTKLELTWMGKENRPQLEPRILLEHAANSYHARTRVSEHDIFDNRLIHGENLLALKALQKEFLGLVKCVYIDPPYNTGAAMEQFVPLWFQRFENAVLMIGSKLHEFVIPPEKTIITDMLPYQ